MHVLKGDLFKLLYSGSVDYSVLIHGCNCFCNFGAGFAKLIKEKFHTAFEADLQTRYGDASKLGTYSRADVAFLDNTQKYRCLAIINAYTQFGYGYINYAELEDPLNPFPGKQVQLHYTSLHNVLEKIAMDFPDEQIILPAIGCGHARGDLDTVKQMVHEVLGDRATMVLF